MTVVELNGSGTLEFSQSGQRGQRIFRITPYEAAEEFCRQQLGSPGEAGPAVPLRATPARFTADSSLYATRCRVEGLGQPGTDAAGKISYAGGARVVVDYEALAFEPEAAGRRPDEPSGRPYLTEEVSIAGEYISLPKKKFKWQSDNAELAADDITPGRLVAKAEWVLTRHQVPNLPRDEIFAALGKVNSHAIGSAAAGTLLLSGAQARREYLTYTTPTWRITFSFLYAPESHNRFYRGHSAGMDLLLTADGDQPVYESTDLRSLLPELR